MSPSTQTPGLSLDAVSLLGFGPKSDRSLPRAEPGTIVLHMPEMSLQELRGLRPELFHDQDWYNRYAWASQKMPSGIYVLRLPVPNSNRMTFGEQQAHNATPAEVVRVRLDFAAWLKTLSKRDRKLALDLARGERTGDVARRYSLSDGRISQLRQELHLSWKLLMLH